MSSLFKPSISPEAARKMLLHDFPLLEMEVDNFLREIGNEVLAFPSLEIQKLFAGVVFELVSNSATPLSDRKELRLSQLEAYLALKAPVPTMTPARPGLLMQANRDIKIFQTRLDEVKQRFIEQENEFLHDEAYWQRRMGLAPAARYQFHMMRNAVKLMYSMPRQKEPLLSEQLIKKIKHVIRLGSEYSFRQKNVMLCNIHRMNIYKLEKQHGANRNKTAYYRLVNTVLLHPELDDADVLINNFLRLKAALLSFDSQDLFLLQWSARHLSHVEIALVRKVVKAIFEDIDAKIFALCQNPQNIPVSYLHYVENLIKDQSVHLESFDELNKRLMRVQAQWHVPKTFLGHADELK